jgi:exonuclease III
MIYEAIKSKKEFQKGNLIEGSSHFLMSFVRFSESFSYLEKITSKKNNLASKSIKSINNKINKVRDGSSYYLFLIARSFMTPLWKITDTSIKAIVVYKDENNSKLSKITNISKSIFSSIILFPFAITGLALAQISHFSAFLLATTPYIHLKGNFKDKTDDETIKVFQNNACLTAGGFALLFGGLKLSNDKRVEMLSKMIKENNSDLVCMQEVSDLTDALSLYDKLKNDYKDFYLNMGATPFVLQNNSGLFVASKEDIKDPDFSSFSNIKNVESMVNKGFFSFYYKNFNFVNTHLSPSKDDLNPTKKEMKTRDKEIEKILSQSHKRSKDRPFFVMGDFNINIKSNEYTKSEIFKKSLDNYSENKKVITDKEATCESEYLINYNWKGKKIESQRMVIDYFLSFFNDKKIDVTTNKISTFDLQKPKDAISDHAALISEIKI